MPTTDFKIEDNVPIPKSKSPKHGYTAVLRLLEVGQSVLIPMTQQNVATTILRAKKGTLKSFTTRKVTSGVRVWRLE